MSSDIIIEPKGPSDLVNWRFYDFQRVLGYPAKRFVSRWGHVALSGVEVADDDHVESIGPEYHVSISKNGGRVSADEVPELLRLFDMEGADEDNHVSGIARHFWKPVAGAFHGFVCPCKGEETAITEGDFIWRPK